MSNSELGHYLKLLRIKNNLTMTQTAESTGITQGYISQIENGIYSPSAKTLAKLARAYNVPEIHLLRKAGIVQLSAPSGDSSAAVQTPDVKDDPLLDISDTRDLLEMMKRGLSNVEYLSEQMRQRTQVSRLPPSEEGMPVSEQISGIMNLPVYDSNWQPISNAAGEPAGMLLPAHLCNDDTDAFILVVADNSMSPHVLAGDWAVVSPATDPQSGDVVAINDRNQIVLRSFGEAGQMKSFVALNPQFKSKNRLTNGGEKVEVVGRVLRVVNREL